MHITIRKGGPIMKNKAWRALIFTALLNALIKTLIIPALKTLGFIFYQIPAHGEGSLRQTKGVLVVFCFLAH